MCCKRTSGKPSQWKGYVYNRVLEIQQSSYVDEWFYVLGKENIADFATREITALGIEAKTEW